MRGRDPLDRRAETAERTRGGREGAMSRANVRRVGGRWPTAGLTSLWACATASGPSRLKRMGGRGARWAVVPPQRLTGGPALRNKREKENQVLTRLEAWI